MRHLFSLRFLVFLWLAGSFLTGNAQCPSIGGAVQGGATICQGSPAPLLTVTGYRGRVIRWEYSINNGITYLPLPSETNITFSPGVVTQQTFFRAVLQQGTCSPARSLPTTVSVTAEVSKGGDLAASQTICSGERPSQLTVSNFTGIIQRWEQSTDGGATWQIIQNVNGSNFTPPALTQSTSYRVAVKNGVCPEAFSTVAIVTVQGGTERGHIEGPGIVCASGNSATLRLVDHVGTVINWQQSPDGENWTDIAGTAGQIFFTLPGNLTVGFHFFRAVVQNGTCTPFFSDFLFIQSIAATVPGALTMKLEDGSAVPDPLCKGANQPDIIITLKGQVGDILRWEFKNGDDAWDEDNPDADGTIENTTTTLTIPNLLDTRQYRAVVRNFPCEADTTEPVLVNIDGDCCEAPGNPRQFAVKYADAAGDEITNRADFDIWDKLKLTFNWTAPANGSMDGGNYHVRYRTLSGGAFSNIDRTDAETDITFDEDLFVLDGVGYEVFVQADCEDPNQPPGFVNSATDTVWICTGVDNSRIKVEEVTVDSAHVQWFDKSATAHYIVEYQVLNVNNWVRLETDQQEIYLTGLSPDTKYRVRVFKLCFDGSQYVLVNPNGDYTPQNFQTDKLPNIPCNEFGFIWTKNGGGVSGNDIGRSVTNDADGNVYVLGSFKGVASFGSFSLSSINPAKYDYYVAKYDADGAVMWANRLGASTEEYSHIGNSIEVDGAGYLFVTGKFYNTGIFGNTVLTSAGGSDIFVSKIRALDGAMQWTRRAGGPQDDGGHGVNIDGSGNVYVTGAVRGTAVFGNVTTSGATGATDVFVAKYNSSGNALWAKRAGGSFDDYGTGITTDEFGYTLTTGAFRSSIDFGGGVTLTGPDDAINMFVVRMDPDGTAMWAKSLRNAVSVGTDIARDGRGNAYIVGAYQGTASWGRDNPPAQRPTNISSVLADFGPVPTTDYFVAKITEDGEETWIISNGFQAEDVAMGVDVDNDGFVYVSGYFNSAQLRFPGVGNLNRNGALERHDIFVVRYNQQGQHLQAVRAGGQDDDESFGVTVDDNRNIFVTGRFKDDADFGDQTVTSAGGSWDSYLGKLSCDKPACEKVPQGLFVSNVGPNAVEVTWTAEAGVRSYELRYRALTSQTWSMQSNITAPPVQLNNIFAGTRYEVQVRAYCEPAGAQDPTPSNYADAVWFETGRVSECPRPTGLVVDNQSETEAVLIWNAVIGAANYEVEYRRVGDAIWTVLTGINKPTATLTSLTPNTRYEVRVRSRCSADLYSSYTPIVRFTTLIGGCFLPAEFTVTQVTPNSALACWSLVEGAIGYNLEWRRKGTTTWNATTTTETCFTLSNLNTDTEYETRVRTVCGISSATSPFSDRIDFRTFPACSAPQFVQILDVTKNTFTLSWEALPGAFGYTVQYKPEGTNTWTSVETTVNAIILENLTAGTTYDVRIRTNCGNDNFSDFGATRKIKTVGACDAAADLSAVTVTVNSILLQWTGTPTIVGYKIEYRRVGQSWNAPIVTSHNFYEFNNLLSGEAYEFRLTSVCSNGEISGFATLTVNTLSCSAPETVEVTRVTPTSATLTWSRVPGIQAYKLYYENPDAPGTYILIDVADATTFTIPNLRSGTRYTVFIQVDCDFGESNSQVVEFTTGQECMPPQNLRVDESGLTENAAPLLWDNAPNASGYILRWKLNDGNNDWKEQPVASNFFVLTGLLPNQSYIACVKSVCGNELSECSNTVIFMTKEGESCCLDPFITGIQSTLNAATINWLFSPCANRYTVSWRRSNLIGAQWFYVNIDNPLTTSFVLSNLLSCTSYDVRVRARCGTQYTAWTQEVFSTKCSSEESLDAAAQSSVIVYPNPNRGYFTVSLTMPMDGPVSLRLMDISGRELFTNVQQAVAGRNEIPVELTDYPTGIYILQVRTGAEERMIKVTVE